MLDNRFTSPVKVLETSLFRCARPWHAWIVVIVLGALAVAWDWGTVGLFVAVATGLLLMGLPGRLLVHQGLAIAETAVSTSCSLGEPPNIYPGHGNGYRSYNSGLGHTCSAPLITAWGGFARSPLARKFSSELGPAVSHE